jgi:hypothetical protein
LPATAEIFATAHIAVTAVISGVLAFLCAMLLQRRSRAVAEAVAVGLVTAAAVFLWRKSANMPQLNTDGLRSFSANDWLAPAITFVFLGVYRNLHPPADQTRYLRAQALATIVALVVNDHLNPT